MRQAAAPLVDGMVREMNATCDSVSIGQGSRTKLSRYLAAKDMSDRVRSQLATHARNIFRGEPSHVDGYRIGSAPSSCLGCGSFPQNIDKSVFDTDGKEYEFYLCLFDDREPGTTYFQGFIPAQKGEDFPFSFDVDLLDVIGKSNWEGMKEILTHNSDDLQRSDGRLWREKWETAGGFHLAVSAVAVQKQRCEASFLGAAMEFLDFDFFLNYGDTLGVSPVRHVRCDVHGETYMDENDFSGIGLHSGNLLYRFRTAATEFWLAYTNTDMEMPKTCLLSIRFHGDKIHDGIGWKKGKENDHFQDAQEQNDTHDQWMMKQREAELDEEPGGWWW